MEKVLLTRANLHLHYIEFIWGLLIYPTFRSEVFLDETLEAVMLSRTVRM